MKLLIFLILPALLSLCEGARILGIVPMPSKSHDILVGRLMKELAKRGHQVTMVSAFPVKKPIANFTHVNIEEAFTVFKEENMLKRMKTSAWENIVYLNRLGLKMTEIALSNPDVQKLKLPNHPKFDLIITEAFLSDAVYAGFSWTHQAPVVAFSTLMTTYWAQYMVGNPIPTSYIPEILLGYNTRMTFCERVNNFLISNLAYLKQKLYLIPKQDALMRKHFGNDLPYIDDLIKNVSLVLVNHHFSLGYPKPYVPNMIEVGGLHVDPPKPLPEDIQKYMDDAKDGVVLFSLGSNLKSSNMPPEKIRAILHAFSRLKQRVLWKFEADSLPNMPPNVKISNWLPQSDILAHPNLKLFITHGGILSTTEAVVRGVPVIGIPIFGDQPLNMRQTENAGFGITLQYEELTSDAIFNAIIEVIYSPKYRENAKLRSNLLKDRPLPPLETAIYWIEYVIRHNGAKHLRSAAQDLRWYELYLIDVILFLGVLSVTLLAVSFYITRLLFKKICRRKAVPVSKKKKNK